MKAEKKSQEIELLDAAIKLEFDQFDKSTLNGAAAAALAGEHYGVSSFHGFSIDTIDPDEKRFWELSCDVELGTLIKLQEYLGERGYSLPSSQVFRDLGNRTVKVFRGEPHHDYCRWVAPQIAAALLDFGLLRDMLQSTAFGVEMYDHEAAFAEAWEILPLGFKKASYPLEAHLQRYGQEYLSGRVQFELF
ncbi:hypothetical protein D3C85_1391710 [compost metagenome]